MIYFSRLAFHLANNAVEYVFPPLLIILFDLVESEFVVITLVPFLDALQLHPDLKLLPQLCFYIRHLLVVRTRHLIVYELSVLLHIF